MRTFWIYFFIFLFLTIVTHSFFYLTRKGQQEFSISSFLVELVIIFITALLISYILRKKKNLF